MCKKMFFLILSLFLSSNVYAYFPKKCPYCYIKSVSSKISNYNYLYCSQSISVHEINRSFLKRKIPQLSNRGSSLKMTVTAYCPQEPGGGGGKTSLGKSAYSRGIAVDPKIIPYGTKIYIPGYGTATADDCGSKIKGYKLDIRYTSRSQVRKWGKKQINVFIYKK